jgi:hypothetical protein
MKTKLILSTIILGSLFLASCEDLLDNPSSTEIAQNLEGNWKCDENSSIFKSTQEIYSVYITPSENDSTKVFISNFYALGNDVDAVATINGYTITLQNQTLAGDYEVRGSGTISSNLKQISWNYFVDDGSGVEDEVTAEYTLQY